MHYEINMEGSFRNANSLCRACLKEIHLTNDECLHIFETPELARKFAACISSEMYPSEKYSQYLCICCCQKVIDFFNFQEMCYASLRRFEELQRFQEICGFEDEIPISVGYGQTSYSITVDEANFMADNDAEIKLAPKSVHITVEKDTKIISDSNRNVPSRPRTPDQLAQNINIEHALVSDGDTLDCDVLKDSFRNNSSFNEYKNAFQTDVNTGRKEKKKLSYVKSAVSKTSGETKKNTIYLCDICPSRFIVEHKLIAHKRKHEGLIPYPCPRKDCSKSFMRWQSLSQHLNQHEGQSMEYACDQDGCGKVYKHRTTLVLHQRKCHKLEPELKTQVCEICGKLFKTTSKLNDHRYTHKDQSERPHACDQPNCMRRFSNKQQLKIHLMRHAGIKNYECPHCGMRKTTKNELNAHINYHTLKRTWACLFCTKVCNNAGNLRTHVRTVHERAKDYACHYCDLSFAKPDTLKYHEMRHTGEKPNVCHECGKRFTQPAALRNHMKTHQKQPKRNKTSKKFARNEVMVNHPERKVNGGSLCTTLKIEVDNTQDLLIEPVV
ncbi:zinc finger protein 317 isoform X2 [Rhagoletis pomonella]|uniref:zinc finger protein 317 isoform X2 n=1 Tax=Rhagoletis pomonella TaxID=28610 RepID=UPI00177BFA9D|nr:zinc finger protein 317 isoform X2 [Rhagoletis pomonella]